MEITGRLAAKGDVREFESGFTIEEFFLDATRFNQTTGEKYSNFIKLQNANEKLDLTPLEIGDQVKVSFGVKGRFYADAEQQQRHAQNLDAFKIELLKKNSELPPLDFGFEHPF